MPERTLHSPDLIAGVAAALFPGLGHIFQGRVKRGVLAMVGVMGLFFYGLMIGGIDAVDSRQDRVWFFGAALMGPVAFATDWVHQHHFKAYDADSGVLRTGRPGEVRDTGGERPTWRAATSAELDAGMGPPNRPALGRLNEIAMLSVALAGMLNLIIFLDALLPDQKTAGSPARAGPKPGSLQAAATNDGGAA